jgi:hypothetical protein
MRACPIVVALLSVALVACGSGHATTVTGSIEVKGKPQGGTAAVAGTRVTISPDASGKCEVPVAVTVSATAPGSSSASSSELVLVYDDKGLHPRDWTASGGGERAAFRSETPTELTIYVPAEVGDERTWVKFTASVAK